MDNRGALDDAAPIASRRHGKQSSSGLFRDIHFGRNLGEIAGWIGLANLIYVLGGGILRQWTLFEGADPIAIGGVRETAITGAIAGCFAIASGRLRWPVLALSALLALWVASESVSAWVLTEQFEIEPLLLALTVAGLALGAAAARPLVSGWTIFLLGGLYVYLNLFVLWRDDNTLAVEFPGETNAWMSDSTGAFQWITTHWEAAKYFGYAGISGNSSTTGTCAAALVAFMAPFALSRWRTQRVGHPAGVWLARAVLLSISAIPGAYLLKALDARSALGGVVCSWLILLVPRRWWRPRRAAAFGAILVPAVLILPVMLATIGLITASDRDCVWASWRVFIGQSPTWGYGPPGTFPGVTCGFPKWFHAHNEILQAWGVSGLLGLLAVVCVLSGLGWFAVRFCDRDDALLLGVMTAAAVQMGFELITSSGWSYALNWLILGMASFVVIVSRSVQVMAASGSAQSLAPQRQQAHLPKQLATTRALLGVRGAPVPERGNPRSSGPARMPVRVLDGPIRRLVAVGSTRARELFVDDRSALVHVVDDSRPADDSPSGQKEEARAVEPLVEFVRSGPS